MKKASSTAPLRKGTAELYPHGVAIEKKSANAKKNLKWRLLLKAQQQDGNT